MRAKGLTRSSLAAAISIVAALACHKAKQAEAEGGAGAGAGASESAACGTLVYARGEGHEHGHSELLRLQLGAEAKPELISTEGLDGEHARARYPAALSPDGTQLLVLASLETAEGKTRDRFELLDLATDGPPTPLAAPAEVMLRNPSWAPDASFIVFESDAESFRDLYRYDFGSASTLRLTDDAAGNFEPVVSPDGQAIAFVSSRDGDAELYRMSADGGSPQRLTTSSGDDAAPRWSPDGRELAFTSMRDRARGIDVFVIPAQGGEALALLPARDEAIIARDLAWSPDGSQLAFTELSPRAGEARVVVVAREGGALVVATDAPGVEQQPAWSPDGRQLVYAHGQRERSELYRLALDAGEGREPIPVTDTGAVAWLPRWGVTADQACARVAPPLAPPRSSGQG